MNKKVKVVIIGAGTAGLTALKQVQKVTDDFVIINEPPYGTTCARVGCMPSKALIQIAKDYHRRKVMATEGIHGIGYLSVDIPTILQHVRDLRDHLTSGVAKVTDALDERSITGQASFISPDTVQVGDQTITAENFIVATGSTPVIPKPWQQFSDRLLTSDTIFEQQNLPERIGVIGLGAIGVELAQALARLEIDIFAFSKSENIASISDPAVNEVAIERLQEDFPFVLGDDAELSWTDNQDAIRIKAGEQESTVDKVLVALGRRPNLDHLNLQATGAKFNQHGLPEFDPKTLQIGDLPIYIAGDANGFRTLQHEAADEGRLTAYLSLHEDAECLGRRVPMGIVFSDPNIARTGLSWRECQEREIIVGEFDFAHQSRAFVSGHNKGYLRVYVSPDDSKLLGAEMMAPDGEHLVHLLAWMIQQQKTVEEILRLPFYHPVVEEGLRSALQNAAKKLGQKIPVPDLPLCDEAPSWSLG